MKRRVLKFIRSKEMLMDCLSFLYRLLMFNSVKGRGGLNLFLQGAFISHTNIVNKGKNNTVTIEKGCRLYNCTIQLLGDNNSCVINQDCLINNLDVWISDGSDLNIGEHTYIAGKTHIACIEGRAVSIGKECMFSNEIVFRTGDSHSIIDCDGNRINHSKDIKIGTHVWIGSQVVILKGASIGDNSIVGTRSLVTSTFGSNCVIGGSPAKTIKQGVSWVHEKI